VPSRDLFFPRNNVDGCGDDNHQSYDLKHCADPQRFEQGRDWCSEVGIEKMRAEQGTTNLMEGQYEQVPADSMCIRIIVLVCIMPKKNRLSNSTEKEIAFGALKVCKHYSSLGLFLLERTSELNFSLHLILIVHPAAILMSAFSNNQNTVNSKQRLQTISQPTLTEATVTNAISIGLREYW
jgi:hypothetical protein